MEGFMRMTGLIPRTRREVTAGLSAGHGLLVRAGFIRQLDRGLFILAPLGFRVWRNIRDIIFEEMERAGVLNLQLPILQPRSLWEKTGRWSQYEQSQTMLQTGHSGGRQYGLAPTAEEVVTWLAGREITSYQDLPVRFHQIGWKMRGELRPHGGLLRGVEFDMSDAYSFDRDEAGMRASFRLFRDLYVRIFDRVGLRRYLSVQAEGGEIGGQGSAEFMALSALGEDVLLTCASCGYGANRERAARQMAHPRAGEGCPVCGAPLEASHGIEVGHIFMLQTRYAEALGATFQDADGAVRPLWMGCYGIGVTRLLQTLVEQSRDDDGIIWPDAVAPYTAIVVPVNMNDATQVALAEEVYRRLDAQRISCVLDDRKLRGGRKFIDADLLGIPWRVLVGRGAKDGIVEVKRREDGTVTTLTVDELLVRLGAGSASGG